MPLIALFIGAATGLAAVLFIKLIYLIQHLSYSTLPVILIHTRHGLPFLGTTWLYLVIPVIGALLVGPLILMAKEAKGHGVPEVMQALILYGGRIRARVAAAKIMASAICIGTGGSAGREGPIIQVGSALGSAIGQIMHLSDERVRNMVACGAAAGIAATFNAPIAGVIFALEVLMCRLQVNAFGNVVVAAVASSIVSRIFLGSSPAFTVPHYSLPSPLSIGLFLILGLFSAFIGIMFIRMLDFSERFFDGWQCPQVFKPAVGAGLLGLSGIIYLHVITPSAMGHSLAMDHMPHMFGAGFPVIEDALLGHGNLWLLLLLTLLKPIATSFTLGSGNSGGVFAPSLFIGAMFGGAMGQIFTHICPEIAGNPGSYALVGMAAVFAAAARAPLTSMLIVFEMSNDYFIILPLMLAGITACSLAQWLHPESIYTLKLAKRGIHFSDGHDMDIMQSVKVQEVMRRHPITIHRERPLSELITIFQDNNIVGVPVMREGSILHGIVTLQDLHRIQSTKDHEALKTMKVADIASTEPITIFADEPIWVAIQKMAPRDLARLPVIDRDGSGRLVGVISRSDILRAYDVGIVRRQRGKMEEKQLFLRDLKGNGFVEFLVKEEDCCNQELVQDLPLPTTINLVSIKRAGRILIPRGKTQVQPGDVITVFGNLQDIDILRKKLKSS